MQKGWLAHAGKFKVDHVPCPHPTVPVDLSAPPSGVVHTIEGSLASGMSVFRRHYAPTFAIGPNRIVQTIPLGEMAAALENHPGGVETNRLARVQIEVEGRSSTSPWIFPPNVLEPLAALMGTLSEASVAGIPLSRPFPGGLGTGIPATEAYSRRHAGKWGRVPGWYGHIEIPENSHWDPGNLKWAILLTRARALAPIVVPPVVKPKPQVGSYRVYQYLLRGADGVSRWYTDVRPR